MHGERFSWYCCADLRANIEPQSCRQYKPGNFLAIRPLNWDEIIAEDDNDENWADLGAPSGGRSHLGDGNQNDDSEREEDMQRGAKGTWKVKATQYGKGNGKATEKGKGNGKGKGKATEEGNGKGKGNGKGTGIVKQTPGGDDGFHAVALQL